LCNSLKVINKSSELKRYRLVLFVQTIFVIIGHLEIAKFLFESHADKESKDEMNHTPLQLASD
jgi:hypothetical protein